MYWSRKPPRPLYFGHWKIFLQICFYVLKKLGSISTWVSGIGEKDLDLYTPNWTCNLWSKGVVCSIKDTAERFPIMEDGWFRRTVLEVGSVVHTEIASHTLYSHSDFLHKGFEMYQLSFVGFWVTCFVPNKMWLVWMREIIFLITHTISTSP